MKRPSFYGNFRRLTTHARRVFAGVLCVGTMLNLHAVEPSVKTDPAPRTPIAVVELAGYGVDKATQVKATEQLQTALTKTEFFKVIDHKQVEAALKEQGAQQSTPLQDSQAIAAGKKAGAQYVAIGKVTVFDGVYQLSVRALNVETGKEDAAATANAATNKIAIACNTVATEFKERISAIAIMNAKQDKVVHLVDERGNPVTKKPSLVTLYLGNRFFLGNGQDTTGIGVDSASQSARNFATTNIIRPGETIYRGSGASIATTSSGFQVEPTLRIGWEIPFQKAKFLSLQFSVEGSMTASRNLISATGNFNYQNAQANYASLINTSYTGTLTATQQRSYVVPMAGLGFEMTNGALQKAGGLRFLANLGVGLAFQSYKRTYDLTLAPQYISAGSYSDTYVIKSSMTQSYSMAPLAAGRVDLGMRFNIGNGLHLSLVGSLTAFYMLSFMPITYDNYGYFAEQAGTNKITFQKITASSTDESSYFELLPAVFLALSREL